MTMNDDSSNKNKYSTPSCSLSIIIMRSSTTIYK